MSALDTTNLLTVAEAAAELRVSRGTAYRWIADGLLPHVRIGGTVRIPAPELHALLTPGSTSTAGEWGEPTS
jgi:excisionase family DNA binding protein